MPIKIHFTLFFSEQDSELNYQRISRKSKGMYQSENPEK